MDILEQDVINKELIISFLSGNSSPDEKKHLQNWVKESDINEQYFSEIKSTWLASSQFGLNLRFNSGMALLKVQSSIKGELPLQQTNIEGITRFLTLNPMLKIAAIILITFLTGAISSYYIFKNAKNASEICYFEAPLGSRVSAGLPDGTQVWLNAGSKLEYNSNFNRRNREVRLTGEGYFKVKTNPQKPFLVKTKEVTIKAFGTAFNVKAYPDEKQVTTTLIEGKVQLEGRGENNKSFSYALNPKQKVTYYKDNKLFEAKQKDAIAPKKIVKKNVEIEIIPLKEIAPIVSNINVNTELYTSWKDERWIIQTENLEDLAVLLERRFNVKIGFKNDILKKYRFSGTIQNETLEQIFDIMRFTMPITYNIDKGNVTIDIDNTLRKKYSAAYLNTK